MQKNAQIKTFYSTEESFQLSADQLKNDKVIRITEEDAYRKCDQCGEEYRLVNNFEKICWKCKRKSYDANNDPSLYAQHYNSNFAKGFTHDQITQMRKRILAQHPHYGIFKRMVYNPTLTPYSAPILYYHSYCNQCGTEITHKDFFHEITDYCCTLFYQCPHCKNYLVEVE